MGGDHRRGDQLQRQIVQPAAQRRRGGVEVVLREARVERPAVPEMAVEHRHQGLGQGVHVVVGVEGIRQRPVASVLAVGLQPPFQDTVADGAGDGLVDEIVGPQTPRTLAREEGGEQGFVPCAGAQRVKVVDELVDDHPEAVGRRLAAPALHDGLVLDQRGPRGSRAFGQCHQVNLQVGHFVEL